MSQRNSAENLRVVIEDQKRRLTENSQQILNNHQLILATKHQIGATVDLQNLAGLTEQERLYRLAQNPLFGLIQSLIEKNSNLALDNVILWAGIEHLENISAALRTV